MNELTPPVPGSLRRAETRPKPHAVIIGSGFGGLAAAIRLGARGYRVTVLEKLEMAGGRAYVHRQDGFTFDAGPTIVTAPYLFEELWRLCGREMADDVELVPIDPFYRIQFDSGESFVYSGDTEAMKAQVASFSPADVAGYEKFMRFSETNFRIGFEKLGDVPFASWRDMARVVPSMMRLASHRSIFKMVSRYIKDPRLRVVFSFHPLLIGGNPLTVSSIYSLICFLEKRWGVHYAMGGTNRLVAGLVKLINGQGNDIRYGAEVAEITLGDGAANGVRLRSGEIIDADIVISNADTAWTYRHLLPTSARRRWTNSKVDRASSSNSLFVWYFGTNRRFENVDHHTMLLGPRYEGLLHDIFKHHRLADDFSLYLHRPTHSDPGLAPPGCDTFYVLAPVPNQLSGIDWTVAAEPYRKRIQERLEAHLMPGLAQSIVTSRLMTPADFESRLLSYRGAAFGMEPNLLQSAWFRPHNKSEDIPNLYIVGAGTHPGAGLPGVLSSAKILDRMVPDAAMVV